MLYFFRVCTEGTISKEEHRLNLVYMAVQTICDAVKIDCVEVSVVCFAGCCALSWLRVFTVEYQIITYISSLVGECW